MKNVLLLFAALVIGSTGIADGHSGVPEATSGFRQPMDNYNYNGYHFNQWSDFSACYHPGADYNGAGTSGDDDLGRDILAVANGLVVDTVTDGTFGLCIAIEHVYQGVTVYSQYAHLQSFLVSEGQTVTKGQHIAELGHSGTGAGEDNAHLHWEIRESDHPNPHMADYWNGSLFDYQSNINDWYEDPEAWCNNHGAYNTYSCAYANQHPTREVHLTPGEARVCTVYFTNTGTTTWYSNQGQHPNDYITLKSVEQNGTSYNSWLYGASLGWLDSHTPCTMQESSVQPQSQNPNNCTATFIFTGKVPTDATTGQQYIRYFRPHHSTGGMLNNWGEMNFDIRVDAPAPTSTTFQSLVGKFTNDGYADVCVYEDTPGDLWVSPNATTDREFTRNTTKWLAGFHSGGGYTALSGDIGGSDLDDVALLNRSLGRWYVAYSYGDHFSEAVGDRTGGMWLDDWGKSSVGIYTPFIADFNDDGYADACLYEAVSGNWYVAYRDLTGNRFLPTNNGNPWITGYGDEVGAYQPIVGDFNADGYADVGLYKISNGNWYIAFNSHSNTFTRQGTTWITGFGDNGTFQALVGQFNGDDHSDIGLYQPSIGYWYVAFNNGDHFTKQNGPETYGAWIIDYGNGSVGQFRPLVGQFSWDAYSDIGLYQPEYGRWFVAILDGNPYRFTRTVNPWLQGWGVETGSPKRSVDDQTPAEFSLSHNYPNPFNPTTTISYTLPSSSHVRIDIYNILGQNISTLVDDQEEPGEHQVTWNAHDQPSGVYFYRITTDTEVQTQKMLLLK